MIFAKATPETTCSVMFRLISGIYVREGNDMALRWRDKRYSTGFDVVDAENHLLFNHIDQLLNAEEPEAIELQLNQLILFLREYAGDYLPREEAIMEQYNCPVRDENRQDHATFRAALSELHNRYANGGINELLREDLMSLVVQWLESHVARVDSQLRYSRSH
jgi:hemerythrin-like metal-binding protein